MSHFNTHTESLDMDFWREVICSRGTLVTFRKGEHYCIAGQPTGTIGWVKSGYFLYTIDGVGKEAPIGGFAFPDALVGDVPNCFYGDDALLSIVAGMASEVYVFDATLLSEMSQENPQIEWHIRAMLEVIYRSLLKRQCDLYTKSPKERYMALISHHPQVFRYAKLGEIASYLQITPTHLSRLRKNLMNG